MREFSQAISYLSFLRFLQMMITPSSLTLLPLMSSFVRWVRLKAISLQVRLVMQLFLISNLIRAFICLRSFMLLTMSLSVRAMLLRSASLVLWVMTLLLIWTWTRGS